MSNPISLHNSKLSQPSQQQASTQQPYDCPPEVVVFDLETTGLSAKNDAIIEIGAIKIRGGELCQQEIFHTLLHPTRVDGSSISIPARASAVHGISDQMVKNAPSIAEVLPKFLSFVGDGVVVAHNARFDCGFMRVAAQRQDLVWAPKELCTMKLSRLAFPTERSHKLDLLAQRLGLQFGHGGRHRSMGDVLVTAQAYLRLLEILRCKHSGSAA